MLSSTLSFHKKNVPWKAKIYSFMRLVQSRISWHQSRKKWFTNCNEFLCLCQARGNADSLSPIGLFADERLITHCKVFFSKNTNWSHRSSTINSWNPNSKCYLQTIHTIFISRAACIKYVTGMKMYHVFTLLKSFQTQNTCPVNTKRNIYIK